MSTNSIAERLGLTDEVKEIKLGKTFGKGGGSNYYHTVRYDFKPASVDPKKMATVDIGEGHQVTVKVPHVDKGSGPTHTVFKGSKKPYQKECVLIIDHNTGEIQLEKLGFNIQLKKFRAEGSSKIKPTIVTDNNVTTNGKKSPVQKLSPQQKYAWPSNLYSPVPKCSPLPKSPSSQPSPPSSQTSPSVPSLVPPSSNALNSRHSSQVPQQDTFPISANDIEIGLMSTSSSSSGSSSSSSSDSESSDEEAKTNKPENSDHSMPKFLPNGVNSPKVKYDSHSAKNALSNNMPQNYNQLSQLSQDLELSESDSD